MFYVLLFYNHTRWLIRALALAAGQNHFSYVGVYTNIAKSRKQLLTAWPSYYKHITALIAYILLNVDTVKQNLQCLPL